MKRVLEVNGRIMTWESIAAVRGVSERAAQDYAAESRAPLRVRFIAGVPFARREDIISHRRRSEKDPTLEKIHGASKILAQLRVDLGKCSWSRYSAMIHRECDPLPVENPTGARQKGVEVPDTWIYLSSYREWLYANDMPYLARLALRSVRRAGNAPAFRARGSLRAG